MLISIKNRSTGIFAWVIVLLIVIPFALFGIQSYFQQGENITVASVNGNEIFKAEFDRQLQSRTDQLASQLGDNFNPEMLEQFGFKQQVLNEMINRQVLEDYIKDKNFQINDEQVRDRIRQQFTINGEFSQDAYQRYLNSTRQSPRVFESLIRLQLVSQQLTQSLRNTAFATPKEIEQVFEIQAQEREIAYVELNPEDFEDQVDISDEQIITFYEENKASFERPEELQVSYVELSLDSLSQNYTPTEEEIQAAYEEVAIEQGQPDTRRASHILVETNDERDLEMARTEAGALLERINAGESFEELAKEFSDDAGSARNGGDLGIINRGLMVEPFENAVFALTEQGQVSDLVETEFGVHIIKLTELNEGEKPAFEDVKDEATELAARTLAQAELDDLRSQLDNLLFEQPEDLAAVASELNLELKSSEWFTENGPVDAQNAQIAQIPQVREAAFDPNVIESGLASPIVDLEEQRYIALQVKERKEAFIPELEEVRDEVVAQLTQEETNQLVASEGEKYLQQLNEQSVDEESWSAWLSENELTAQEFRGQRSDLSPNLMMASQSIFSMASKQEGYSVLGEQLSDGRYLIVSLKAVVKPDPYAASEEAQTQRSQITQALNRENVTQTINSLTQALRADADIFIDEEQL